jgi:pyruvoyl-dependent arginine decarboxylase (PvlArgDC)
MFELVMVGNERVNDLVECTSEAKTMLEEYYSVQFFLNDKGPTYLFKLRNISSNGPCILVKQDSSVFKELKVGDLLDMKYNRPESFGDGETFKTIITSKIPDNHYTGYYIVELSIINNQEEKCD